MNCKKVEVLLTFHKFHIIHSQRTYQDSSLTNDNKKFLLLNVITINQGTNFKIQDLKSRRNLRNHLIN